jgi:DedD protein
MAAEALTDQEKQFRKRARRRLIGAVALVLLMVTVLPMLLDDRSDQAPHPDVAISIPSQDDGNFASKIVPAPAANVAPATPDTTGQPAVPAVATVAPPPPVAAPAAAEPAPAAAAEPKPEPKPAPEPVKPVAKQQPKAESSPAAKPKPAPVAAEKAGTSKAEGVSIQVGVFSDSDKVTQIKSKLSGLGIKCGTEPLNTKTGVKVRMRCGPYADKAEAEKAQESLKSAGFNNTILVSHQ